MARLAGGARFLGGMLIAVTVSRAAALEPESAQNPVGQDPAAYYMVTYIEVAPSATADAVVLLQAIAASSRKETGNQRYDILRRIDRDNQFAILEAWSGPKAAEAHAGGDAFRQFREKLGPLQVSFYDERPSTGIAVTPATVAVGRDAVYVITHVDVTPPNKDACIGLLRQLADDTRSDRASLRFEAWQQNSRANHFTVAEVWIDRAAIDSHVAAPSTREFRDRLGPMSGALYDERLYRSL